ncbi:MAG: hypothetical protein ACRDRR_18385 [Pseudonocardiaceae bacterium]
MTETAQFMRDHWWWPGWRVGRSSYTWHVTFDDQPAVHRLAAEMHRTDVDAIVDAAKTEVSHRHCSRSPSVLPGCTGVDRPQPQPPRLRMERHHHCGSDRTDTRSGVEEESLSDRADR